jgi:hypothetical protein
MRLNNAIRMVAVGSAGGRGIICFCEYKDSAEMAKTKTKQLCRPETPVYIDPSKVHIPAVLRVSLHGRTHQHWIRWKQSCSICWLGEEADNKHYSSRYVCIVTRAHACHGVQHSSSPSSEYTAEYKMYEYCTGVLEVQRQS